MITLQLKDVEDNRDSVRFWSRLVRMIPILLTHFDLASLPLNSIRGRWNCNLASVPFNSIRGRWNCSTRWWRIEQESIINCIIFNGVWIYILHVCFKINLSNYLLINHFKKLFQKLWTSLVAWPYIPRYWYNGCGPDTDHYVIASWQRPWRCEKHRLASQNHIFS